MAVLLYSLLYVECLVSTNTFVCRHPKVGLERQQSHEVTINLNKVLMGPRLADEIYQSSH